MTTPMLNGLKLSFPDLEQTKLTWAYESFKAIAYYSQIRGKIEAQLNVSNMMKMTRERLRHHLEMCEAHVRCLSDILMPLGWSGVQANAFTQYVMKHPKKSIVLGNYENLFRDWIWGDEENQLARDRILQAFPEGFKPEKILVLGSGAGRLSYDLYKSLNPSRLTLVDINPLLMMASQRILSGKELEMVEFPFMASSKDHIGIVHKLKAPEAVDDSVDFLLADARHHDFSEEQYDLVVTPWLIDVIDSDLNQTCEFLKRVRGPDTKWINFGPVGFNSPELRFCYTTEEALYIIEKQGWKLQNKSLEPFPYMRNPSSHSTRTENVLTFFAELP